MNLVRFNTPAEFMDELDTEAPHLPQPVLRLTNLFRRSILSPNIQHLSVVATFETAYNLIRLDAYCGDLLGHNRAKDKEVLQKAGDTHRVITDLAKRLKLAVRSGVIEPAEGATHG